LQNCFNRPVGDVSFGVEGVLRVNLMDNKGW